MPKKYRLSRLSMLLPCLVLLLGTLFVPAARAGHAAAPSLSAAGAVAPGLTLSATVRPGPYFAGEAIVVGITLHNSGRKAIALQQANACRFAAQVVVIGRSTSSPILPPDPLCTGLPSTLTLAPGARLSGAVLTMVPVVHGPGGKSYRVSLKATALLGALGAAKAATFSLLSGQIYIPFVAGKAASGARPEQTLRLSVRRDTQGFIVGVTDGRNHTVAGVSGWYVVRAPDGNLAWGVAGVGRTYCGAGCQTDSRHGVYTLSVWMARDGYSFAATTLTYKA